MDNIPPTRDNVLNALSWLDDDASFDDSLFIHYSGHGSQTVDTNGDEVDGKDEGFHPIISPTNKLLKVYTLAVIECIGPPFISDDASSYVNPSTTRLFCDPGNTRKIHEKLKSLPCCCWLTTLFDSCHSGTILDLPYVYDSGGQRERAVAAAVLDNISADVVSIYYLLLLDGQNGWQICWPGAKDNQEGTDMPQGDVMTRAFIKAFQEDTDGSYKQLLHSIKHLEPLDFLHLSRLTKGLRGALFDKASVAVWKLAWGNVVDLSRPPEGTSEPTWVSLIYETRCCHCQKYVRFPDFSLRIRICHFCAKIHLKEVQNIYLCRTQEEVTISRFVVSIISLEYVKITGGRKSWDELYFLPKDFDDVRAKLMSLKPEDMDAYDIAEIKQFVLLNERAADHYRLWYDRRPASNVSSDAKTGRIQAIREKLISMGYE
ncbi:hypothetical protein IW262DRAFT_1530343 [Armillaria fumosa]|nr:hypothetical protein IW262DRAFT_1530343 [Armillaria fumosa]